MVLGINIYSRKGKGRGGGRRQGGRGGEGRELGRGRSWAKPTVCSGVEMALGIVQSWAEAELLYLHTEQLLDAVWKRSALRTLQSRAVPAEG